MSIATRVDFFFFCTLATRVRGATLLFAHRIAIEFSHVHEVFPCCCGPFDWRPVSIVFEVAGCTADSDLEDGELQNMLASPLYMQSREDYEFSRMMPIAPGKPAALFSNGSEEPGNQFKSSVFKHAHPSNLGISLLEGNEDHLLSQANSEFMRQEHQVGSLNHCISELQQQA